MTDFLVLSLITGLNQKSSIHQPPHQPIPQTWDIGEPVTLVKAFNPWVRCAFNNVFYNNLDHSRHQVVSVGSGCTVPATKKCERGEIYGQPAAAEELLRWSFFEYFGYREYIFIYITQLVNLLFSQSFWNLYTCDEIRKSILVRPDKVRNEQAMFVEISFTLWRRFKLFWWRKYTIMWRKYEGKFCSWRGNESYKFLLLLLCSH